MIHRRTEMRKRLLINRKGNKMYNYQQDGKETRNVRKKDKIERIYECVEALIQNKLVKGKNIQLVILLLVILILEDLI